MKPRATRKSKARSARIRQVPLWLRRLDRVKAELKGTRFPRTAEEGFRQCAALSGTAIRWFRDSLRNAQPGATDAEIELARRTLLARLSAAEGRWLEEWRKERARYFRG